MIMSFSEENYYKTRVLRSLKRPIKTKNDSENNQKVYFFSSDLTKHIFSVYLAFSNIS